MKMGGTKCSPPSVRIGLTKTMIKIINKEYNEGDIAEVVEHPEWICECQKHHQCNDCGKKLKKKWWLVDHEENIKQKKYWNKV